MKKFKTKDGKVGYKSYFHAPFTKQDGEHSVSIVEYKWNDGETYEGIQFQWYANTKFQDRVWDIVLPSAFDNSLSIYMQNPILLLQHHSDKPIWNIVEASIDSVGLFVTWIIKVDEDQVFDKVKKWVLKAMSIGFQIMEEDIVEVEWRSAIEIRGLELFEISIVGVPCNRESLLKSKAIWDMSDDEISKAFNLGYQLNYTFEKSLNDLLTKIYEMKQPKNKIEESKKEMDEKEESQEETQEEWTESNVDSDGADANESADEWSDNWSSEGQEEAGEESDDNEEESKEDEDEEKDVEWETKDIDGRESLGGKLTDALKEKLNIADDEYLYVVEFTDEKVIYNYFGRDFDKYFKATYVVNGDSIEFGDSVEVESKTDWIEVTRSFKDGIFKDVQNEKKDNEDEEDSEGSENEESDQDESDDSEWESDDDEESEHGDGNEEEEEDEEKSQEWETKDEGWDEEDNDNDDEDSDDEDEEESDEEEEEEEDGDQDWDAADSDEDDAWNDGEDESENDEDEKSASGKNKVDITLKWLKWFKKELAEFTKTLKNEFKTIAQKEIKSLKDKIKSLEEGIKQRDEAMTEMVDVISKNAEDNQNLQYQLSGIRKSLSVRLVGKDINGDWFDNKNNDESVTEGNSFKEKMARQIKALRGDS